jgi:hypothetical protein
MEIVLTGVEATSNKATDFNTVNNTLYPSVKAISDYLASLVTSNTVYMLTNSDHSIGSSYKQMVMLPNFTPSSGSSIVSVQTTETLMGVFATNTGSLNTTNIPIGSFTSHYETQKASGSNNYYTYFKVYKRNLAGTETLLATSDNTTQTSINTVVQQTTTAFVSSPISLLSTDLLVVKIYGIMLSSSANITLTFDDNTNARFSTPSLSANEIIYTSRAYSSGNFSAVGGNVSVDSEDYYDRYKIIGKTLFWESIIYVNISSNPSEIQVKFPNSSLANGTGGAISTYVEGQGLCINVFDSDRLSIRLASGADFANGFSNIYINLTLEIQ